MLRWHVVSAVFGRNVKQYFSGVLGYLFIVVFVTVCAMMAFDRQFFADNLANLDQLSRWYPVLLLFFVPAITMSVWADEKRLGTDAILFTLPASDLEILIGKYLAVAAVYTIALMFSATQLIALRFLGNPDWGVVFATYVGYWLAGLALLSVGMFASSLTKSTTVAFVFGGLLCALPVLIGVYFRGAIGLEQLGMDWNLRDFTLGLIPLANIVYFVSLTAFMLYLNLVVISRRHWSRGQQVSLGSQFLIRVVSLAVGLVALNYITSNAAAAGWARLDLTAEKLYSLDTATLTTLQNARENQRKVTVQAFVSDEVPRKFVNTKKQFTGLLRQFSLNGGNFVDVRFVDVQPNSPQAQEAQQLGIQPRGDRSEVGGKIVEQDVYMGALVSSSQGDVTIPFVDVDSAIEYELSRSVATTTDKSPRLTLGVVDTDAFFAGPEYSGRRLGWAYDTTLNELKKQFKITHIGQDELNAYVADPADDQADEVEAETGDGEQSKKPKIPPDVLLVADPASLNDLATDALVKYLEAGHPTILLADPLPFYWTFQNPRDLGVLNAPRQPRVSPRSPYSQILSSSPLPKADGGRAIRIMTALGIQWDNGQAAWSLDDPHPSFKGAWPEIWGDRWPELYGPYEKALVFARSHPSFNCFNIQNPISAGLKELLFFYPGSIRQDATSQLNFDPLVTLDARSGVTDWDNLTMIPMQQLRRFNPSTGRSTTSQQPAMSQITQEALIVMNPSPQSYLDDQTHVVAAHISAQGKSAADGSKINAVLIADLDFVSDLFYEQQSALGQQLDNYTLLLNAIEVLTGDEIFVALRNRRPSPRSLTTVEEQVDKFRAERAKKQEEIESRVRQQLDTAQLQLNEATKKIEENQSLSFFEKLQQTSQEASTAQRRFDLEKEQLDKELKLEIDRLRSDEQQQIASLENRIRSMAVLLAPAPALLLGVFVLMARTASERRHISVDRRAD